MFIFIKISLIAASTFERFPTFSLNLQTFNSSCHHPVIHLKWRNSKQSDRTREQLKTRRGAFWYTLKPLEEEEEIGLSSSSVICTTTKWQLDPAESRSPLNRKWRSIVCQALFVQAWQARGGPGVLSRDRAAAERRDPGPGMKTTSARSGNPHRLLRKHNQALFWVAI